MRLFLLFITVMMNSVMAADPVPTPTPPKLSPLYVLVQGRCVKFSVEIADTSLKLQQGLMMRKELPLEQGMLFVFPKDEKWSMWMENTLMPLDMIFVDAHGVVQKIQHAVPPKSLAIQRPDVPVRFVLEISGGLAEKMGLKVTDTIVHEGIGNKPPSHCQTAQVISQLLPSKSVQKPAQLPLQKARGA